MPCKAPQPDYFLSISIHSPIPARHQCHVPDRLTGQGDAMLKASPHADFTLDTETPETEFLQEAGWDPETCKPSKAKLDSLGLADVARMIHA